MIKVISQDYPVAMVCDVLNLARSTYYEDPKIKAGDVELKEVMEKIIMKRPYYGYRRILHEMKRKGYVIGETRVRRLLNELEHSCSMGKVSVSTTDSNHSLPRYPNLIKDLDITHLNQVWVSDITYIRLGRQFIYLAVILDAYSRGARLAPGAQLGERLNHTSLEESISCLPSAGYSSLGPGRAICDAKIHKPISRNNKDQHVQKRLSN